MLSGSEMGIRDAPHPQDVKRPSVVRQFASEPHHHANYRIMILVSVFRQCFTVTGDQIS